MFIKIFIHKSTSMDITENIPKTASEMENIAIKKESYTKDKNQMCSQITEQAISYSQTIQHSKSLMLFNHWEDFSMRKTPFCFVIEYLFCCIFHCISSYMQHRRYSFSKIAIFHHGWKLKTVRCTI